MLLRFQLAVKRQKVVDRCYVERKIFTLLDGEVALKGMNKPAVLLES